MDAAQCGSIAPKLRSRCHCATARQWNCRTRRRGPEPHRRTALDAAVLIDTTAAYGYKHATKTQARHPTENRSGNRNDADRHRQIIAQYDEANAGEDGLTATMRAILSKVSRCAGTLTMSSRKTSMTSFFTTSHRASAKVPFAIAKTLWTGSTMSAPLSWRCWTVAISARSSSNLPKTVESHNASAKSNLGRSENKQPT
jgi:hypothetical protein